MEQYISKSAVVAEIERRKRKLLDNIICEGDKEWVVRTAHQLNRILLFLDTLEVKEVDLDYIKDELDRVVKIYKPDGDFGWGTLYNIATHFFELGLKVQKGE